MVSHMDCHLNMAHSGLVVGPPHRDCSGVNLHSVKVGHRAIKDPASHSTRSHLVPLSQAKSTMHARSSSGLGISIRNMWSMHVYRELTGGEGLFPGALRTT